MGNSFVVLEHEYSNQLFKYYCQHTCIHTTPIPPAYSSSSFYAFHLPSQPHHYNFLVLFFLSSFFNSPRSLCHFYLFTDFAFFLVLAHVLDCNLYSFSFSSLHLSPSSLSLIFFLSPFQFNPSQSPHLSTFYLLLSFQRHYYSFPFAMISATISVT